MFPKSDSNNGNRGGNRNDKTRQTGAIEPSSTVSSNQFQDEKDHSRGKLESEITRLITSNSSF